MMTVEIRLNWLVIPLIAIATLIVGRHFTSGNMLWYSTLKLPSITPPSWMFSNIWMLIYILTTLCALIVYNMFERTPLFWSIVLLFCASTFLNGYWTYLFFKNHYLDASTICAAVLSGTIWLLMYLINKTSTLTGLLLLPYAVWTSFATLLNLWIWFIN